MQTRKLFLQSFSYALLSCRFENLFLKIFPMHFFRADSKIFSSKFFLCTSFVQIRKSFPQNFSYALLSCRFENLFLKIFPMHFFRADSKICDFLIVRHSPYNPSVIHTCFCKQAFNACPNHFLSALLKANAKTVSRICRHFRTADSYRRSHISKSDTLQTYTECKTGVLLWVNAAHFKYVRMYHSTAKNLNPAVPLQKRHPFPPHLKQLTSTSALGSVEREMMRTESCLRVSVQTALLQTLPEFLSGQQK